MLSLPRLALLVACTSFVACASGPEPRSGGDDSAETKRKKKKKRKKRKSNVFAKKEVVDDEVTITDDPEIEDEDDDEEVAARPKKKSRDRDRNDREDREREEREEREREEREREEREREERKLAEREDREREQREEREREQREEREREQAAARSKRKKAKVVAAKARKKRASEEDIPEIEMDSEPEEPDAEEQEEEEDSRSRRRSKRDRQSDDEGDVIEMTGLDEDPLAEPRVAAIAVPGVDDEEPSDEPEEVALPAGAWPMQINDRPLVLAKDKLAAHAGLRVSKLTLPGATPDVKTSTTSQFLTLGGTYGIGEKAEVGFDYALGISPGTVKGPFTLHGAYRAVVKNKLEIAVAAGLAIDFAEITDAMMMTTTLTSYSLQLGAWARYRINRKVSLFSGVPATPASPATLSKLSFALPPLPYQLALGLNNSGTVALDVPAGLGYQAKPNVYAFVMLNLAHLRIANTENAFLFADFIPFTLGGFYTRKQLDVGVVFADDLKQGSDFLRLDLLVRYSIK